MLIGEKLKFKSRKGQWRKRVIGQITKMVHPDHSRDTWDLLTASAKLARMGVSGETHLRNAIALDFSDTMRHDIRMILFTIAVFGVAWGRVHKIKNAITYVPSAQYKDEIWNARDHYIEWTTHTRTQFNALHNAIWEMS